MTLESIQNILCMGKFTADNLNPTLTLGYDSTSSSKLKRKLPAAGSVLTAACATAETKITGSPNRYAQTFDYMNIIDHCSVRDSPLKVKTSRQTLTVHGFIIRPNT
jgi:hypothetical protein